MSALIVLEAEPVLVGQCVTIAAISVIRVATLGQVLLEKLVMLFTELATDLVAVKELFASATSKEANDEALE